MSFVISTSAFVGMFRWGGIRRVTRVCLVDAVQLYMRMVFCLSLRFIVIYMNLYFGFFEADPRRVIEWRYIVFVGVLGCVGHGVLTNFSNERRVAVQLCVAGLSNPGIFQYLSGFFSISPGGRQGPDPPENPE